MRRTIYIIFSKSFFPAASLWGNALRHCTWNVAAKDKFGSLGITSVLNLFFWLIRPNYILFSKFSDALLAFTCARPIFEAFA